MTNHPNRSSRIARCRSPQPAEVKAARDAAGLTQEAAGDLVCCTGRAWRLWESGERQMHAATWRLFRILTNID